MTAMKGHKMAHMTSWRIFYADLEVLPHGAKVSYMNMFGRTVDEADYTNEQEARTQIQAASKKQGSTIEVTVL